MLRAIGYATKKNFWTERCMESFEKHMACQWRIEDVPFRWSNIVDFVLEMARKFPEDILVPIDLWDCLFIGTADELLYKVEDRPLLFCATKLCWPDEKLTSLYTAKAQTASPYQYLNACGPIGKGRYIESAIEMGSRLFPIKPWDDNEPDEYRQDTDQRFWTWIYLHGFGLLDSYCQVFQVLNSIEPGELITDGERVKNTITGSEPCILHAAHNTHELIPEKLYA